MLEAIVALVLISSIGIALFAWINTNLMSMRRIDDANQRAEAMLNVLEYMDKMNPMLTPEGQFSFGRYRMNWTATPKTAVTDGIGFPGGIGLYQYALYDTALRVETAEGKNWFNLSLHQLGFKRARALSNPEDM